jgi:hypothetical protein
VEVVLKFKVEVVLKFKVEVVAGHAFKAAAMPA